LGDGDGDAGPSTSGVGRAAELADGAGCAGEVADGAARAGDDGCAAGCDDPLPGAVGPAITVGAFPLACAAELADVAAVQSGEVASPSGHSAPLSAPVPESAHSLPRPVVIPNVRIATKRKKPRTIPATIGRLVRPWRWAALWRPDPWAGTLPHLATRMRGTPPIAGPFVHALGRGTAGWQRPL
jgi:hypothetical protein